MLYGEPMYERLLILPVFGAMVACVSCAASGMVKPAASTQRRIVHVKDAARDGRLKASLQEEGMSISFREAGQLASKRLAPADEARVKLLMRNATPFTYEPQGISPHPNPFDFVLVYGRNEQLGGFVHDDRVSFWMVDVPEADAMALKPVLASYCGQDAESWNTPS